jgi:hypothetical protein
MTGWKFALGTAISLAVAFNAFAAGNSAELREKYASLGESLARNQFQRPIHIDSREASNDLEGDVYAVVDHPFAVVNKALSQPGNWCDVLILHLNTKYCRQAAGGDVPRLTVAVGKKFDQPLKDAHKLDFSWQKVASTSDFLDVRMDSKSGPLGTRDYRIQFSAVPVDSGRTFIHLRYSYGFGMAGRIAMQGYLATAGSSKVGFSVTGQQADGKPAYVGGVRGVLERNVMRYYLAIDAYLDALDAPPDQQFEQRIQAWFTASDRYPRQLREVERNAYLQMKRNEYQRQQTAAL